MTILRLGQIFHISLDTLAWGVQPEDPAVDQMVRRLREMSPVDRDLNVVEILAGDIHTLGQGLFGHARVLSVLPNALTDFDTQFFLR